MSVQHKNIAEANLHEPKGVSVTTANNLYVSDGAGSGNWTPLVTPTIALTDAVVGEAIVSDGAGNVEIKKPELLEDGWRDMIMPFTASEKGVLNAPTFKQAADDAGGGSSGTTTGVWTYAFSATAEEELFMNFHVDHDYKVGTAFYPHVHWMGDNTDTGVVRWGIEWAYAIRNDTTPVSISATTTTYLEQAATGTAYQHIVTEIADPGIVIPGASVDMIIMARVFRDATHANDTYTGEALGLFLDAHYQVDRYATPNKAPDFYT